MDRCPVTGDLRLDGKYCFTAWCISYSWPEEQCTYEVCTRVCKWIEDHSAELMAQTVGMDVDEASCYMIDCAVDELRVELEKLDTE
jgi:hypothetical protein